ncbi:hypothetical protein PFISCL1PPCAC_1876 [Pristionchus fissidentatus]|uniref:BAH domain-containing protein n=1 Tax=Pristionchus fissidentatus TaxID=1538716 RepID=A0AAV5UTZ4_9BILA|nr:hypothetical protein PFISCL1PPCAC_1876 [Pristionchus fissidentatus]
MHKEMTSIGPQIPDLPHPFTDSSMPSLPKGIENEFMIPLAPIITVEHPPMTLSPPYTPSSSQCSPALVLSPKDFAPFRAFRTRDNVNYSEVKRRTKKSDDVKCAPPPPKKKKLTKVIVKAGDWKGIGKPIRKRVYINNSTGGQFRPCFDEVERNMDKLILREGDDVTAVTEDEKGERITGVARITKIYVTQKTRDLHAAILWYYLPSQVEDDSITPLPHEIFPSKHLDSLPLRSIIDKVNVLRTSQYIEYMASIARSKTFPYSQEKKVNLDENKFFFARFPYDCVKKKILPREKKGI